MFIPRHLKAWGSAVVGLATVVGTGLAAIQVWPGLIGRDDTGVISIDPPENGTILRCATIQGSAPARKGKVLWLALAVSSSTPQYAFRKPTIMEGSRWRERTTLSGSDAGRTYVVSAFYLDQADSEFVEGLGGPGADGRWTIYNVSARRLPTNAQGVVSRSVLRANIPDDPVCP